MPDTITGRDYLKQSEVGDYMKFDKGDNRIRVLDKPIEGIEYWTDIDGVRRPVRKTLDEEIVLSEVAADEGGLSIKGFIAMPVYNFAYNKIQILTITQKTIKEKLQRFESNPKWGDLRNYNIVINKSGTTKMDTEYDVTAEPRDEAEEQALASVFKEYKNMKVDMSKFYSTAENPNGGNPLSRL